jgi:O-antigen biosynthesis protein
MAFSPLIRLAQLLITSFRTLRQKGVSVFVRRIFAWLRGERGFHHRLTLTSIPYELYRQHTAPGDDTLAEQRELSHRWPTRIQIITVISTDDALARTAESLFTQSYEGWSWLVVGETSHRFTDPRVTHLAPGLMHTDSLNLARQQVREPYTALVECGDMLAPHALYEIANRFQQSPNTDVIYTDLDEVRGDQTVPLFKPDWSPEMMLSFDLLDGLGVYRSALLPEFASHSAYRWDAHLRISEVTAAIEHVPQVLYHRHTHQNPTPEAIRQTLCAYLIRRGLEAPEIRFVEGVPFSSWNIAKKPFISIIVPSQDQCNLLKGCLESILAQTTYEHYEILVIDTGSIEADTHALYKHYADHPRFRLVNFVEPFNFSRVCNIGAAHASGDLLLFLNNDTEILQPDWLQLLAQWFEQPGVGVVGPKLLFPNGEIQHGGMIVGIQGLADNFMAHLPENSMTLLGHDTWYRNFLAVTGACLMISSTVFKQVGGFEEQYQLVFSDVKLCLDALAAGYRVVYTPHVRLIHHEGQTRHNHLPLADVQAARAHFRPWLLNGDPYFNPNLSTLTSVPILRTPATTLPRWKRGWKQRQ